MPRLRRFQSLRFWPILLAGSIAAISFAAQTSSVLSGCSRSVAGGHWNRAYRGHCAQ